MSSYKASISAINLECSPRGLISTLDSLSSSFKPMGFKRISTVDLWGTDISQKDEKPSKKRQNRTRDGKVCEDEAQSKSRADYANLGNFIYKRKKGEKENEKKKDVEGLFFTPSTTPTHPTWPKCQVGNPRAFSIQGLRENTRKLRARIYWLVSHNCPRHPPKGYEDAIVVPEIEAANFEIKHGLLTLVQNKQFFGNDKEDPHAHIRYFNKITSTLRYPNVPTTSIKLMLFPFSLEGAARIWLEKEPPRSIQTWDDLVAKFINQFFPPSKTTNLRNEITNFKQRFDESFSEAWDRFKDLLRACPHHGFSELHQLDTFYNALNVNDQDSLNSAAGGNFLDKRPADCSSIIESKSKVRHSRSKAIIAKVSTSASTSGVSPDVAELKDMVRALLLDKQTSPVPAPAPIKAVEQSCVTCGGAHSYRNCPATDGNNYRDNIQGYVSQAAAANGYGFGFVL
ncbi:reverse transcriptase domain-containing protein [Tanacetum coccineum]